MRIYLNGQLCAETTAVNNLPEGLVVVIGQISDGRFERSFYGQLDECAIYDRALTEAEIKQHLEAAQFIGASDLVPNNLSSPKLRM